LEQSFTACMPLLIPTSTFRFQRRCQSSSQWCYLHRLYTVRPRVIRQIAINAEEAVCVYDLMTLYCVLIGAAVQLGRPITECHCGSRIRYETSWPQPDWRRRLGPTSVSSYQVTMSYKELRPTGRALTGRLTLIYTLTLQLSRNYVLQELRPTGRALTLIYTFTLQLSGS